MPRSVSPNGERHETPHRKGHDGRPGEHRPVERAVGQQQRRADVAAHAVLAAGHLGPAQADAPDDHAERQRQQQEIDARGTHREQGENRRDQGRGENTERKGRSRRQPGLGGGVDHDVGGDAEDCAVAERGAPGKAARGYRSTSRGCRRSAPRWRGRPGNSTAPAASRRRSDHDQGGDQCGAAGHAGESRSNGSGSCRRHVARPNRPSGRNASSSAIGPKITK